MIKLVKNPQGDVVAFGSHEGYEPNIPVGYTLEEVETYIPTLSVVERKAIKQREIDVLEAGQFMTRGEREGWIAMVLAQASAQSVPEPTLYLSNSFYKKLKDVNTQVTLLRAEMKAIV